LVGFFIRYAGYADERGAGLGEGFNLNLPLPAGYDDEVCHMALAEGLSRIRVGNRCRPTVPSGKRI
jgi:acetoin utilization deacetylase AcuC-like enzyme